MSGNHNRHDLFGAAAGRTGHPYMMWDSIQAGPDRIRGCLEGEAFRQAEAVCKKIRADGIRRVYLFGCGTSYFAGIGIAYALNRWAEIDADSFDAFEFGRYRKIPSDSRAMAIAVSHSGHTKVDVEAVEYAKQMGIPTVSLTDVPDSPLASSVDFVILAPGGRDPALPKTWSYLAALFKGYMIAAHLAGKPEIWDDLRRVPDSLQAVKDGLETSIRELANRLKNVSRVAVIGGGPNSQLAQEIALKFTEAALIPAQGLAIEEAMHGPLVGLDETTAVVLLSSHGPSRQKVGAYMKAAATIGCPVVEVTMDDPIGTDGVQTIRVPGGIHVDECITPVVLAYPLQMLVYWTALARGINPDVIRTNVRKYREAMQVILPPGTH